MEKPNFLEAGDLYLDLYAHFRNQAIERIPGADPDTIRRATESTLTFLSREYGIELVQPQLSIETEYLAEAPAPGPRTIVPEEKPDPPPPHTISDAQLKRLHAIAGRTGWTHEAVKLLIKRSLGLDSTKDLTPFEYVEVCASLLSVDPKPFNEEAVASDPQRYVKRFRALVKELGLKKKDGDELIQQSMSDRYPGKKSAELIPAEADAVRDSILIAWAVAQLGADHRVVVSGEYMQMVGALGDEDEPAPDAQVAQTWAEVVRGLVAAAKSKQLLVDKASKGPIDFDGEGGNA